MTAAQEFLFYTTSGCHLCERALALVQAEPLLAGHWLSLEDVADSDQLLACYGERIPVLAAADGRELGWPFDAAALRDFVIQVVSPAD